MTGLRPDTTYVVWVQGVRAGVAGEPSGPHALRTRRVLDLSDSCADGYHSNCDSMARPCECHCHEEQKVCPTCEGQALLSGAGPNLAWVCVDCGWEVMA